MFCMVNWFIPWGSHSFQSTQHLNLNPKYIRAQYPGGGAECNGSEPASRAMCAMALCIPLADDDGGQTPPPAGRILSILFPTECDTFQSLSLGLSCNQQPPPPITISELQRSIQINSTYSALASTKNSHPNIFSSGVYH